MSQQSVNSQTILMQASNNGKGTPGTIGQPITYEKIPTQIFADSKEASNAVAKDWIITENGLCNSRAHAPGRGFEF
jgi:glucosamine-6-phosphate deaminase